LTVARRSRCRAEGAFSFFAPRLYVAPKARLVFATIKKKHMAPAKSVFFLDKFQDKKKYKKTTPTL
jgi:hypothetical protein